MLSAEHKAYLSSRGLSPETCERVGITSAGKALSFPYLNGRRETLFNKLRSLDKRFWIEPAGSQLRAWNLPSLARELSAGSNQTLVICEGEFDALACIQAGYNAVTSVPNGAPNVSQDKAYIDPLDDKAFSYLIDEHGQLRREFSDFQTYILFTDNDEPGIRLRNDLAIRLGPERCFVPIFPDDCKDANEILQQHGEEGVHRAIQGVTPLVPDVLSRLDDIPDSGPKTLYKSGWRSLNDSLTLYTKSLTVVTGKPNAGKSTWALCWALNIARKYGAAGAVIQFEDDIERTRYEVGAYVRKWRNSPDREITDKDTGEVYTEPNYCKDPHFVAKYLRFVPPSVEEDDTRDLTWLRDTIKEAAQRHGCKWIIIDPWNEIEHFFDRSMREDQYLNDALREIKRLARRYDIAIIIVAHPDKAGGRNEGIDDMTLYSISGGAVWKNKADFGIVLARETDGNGFTGNTLVKVDKVKNQRVGGTPGMATLSYDREQNLFKSVK